MIIELRYQELFHLSIT